MDWYEKVEYEAQKHWEAEQGRKLKIAEAFLAKAKTGDLFTFKFGTMDPLATELRKDFEDHTMRFSVDPTAALVYLGESKRQWKDGPYSFQFIGTNSQGDTAVVWMDQEMLESLCEYKKR